MARTDRINLSTRPFYNDRLVHAILGVAAVAVLAFTAFNLWEVYIPWSSVRREERGAPRPPSMP